MNLIKTSVLCAAAVTAIACCNQALKTASPTEALDGSSWKESVWISATDAEVVTGEVKSESNYRAADGSSWFVSTVTNDKKVVSAKWMATGLGVFQLYLNGEAVGEEFLRPGFTHYAKTKIAYTYDITPMLKTGKGAENQFSAQLTPGWWGDKIITPGGHDGMIGKKCAFRAVVELCFADGTRKIYGTNLTDWKAGVVGPVKHAAIFDGEEYDAREVPGYQCADKLGVPEENTEFNGQIFPTAGAEIYLRNDLALAPVKAYTWKDVTGASDEEYGKVVVIKEFSDGEEMTVVPGENLVIDFGQNSAAVPAFTFKAEEGTVITCLPAELLNDGNGARNRGMDGPEGSCHRTNLRTPEGGMLMTYTFGAGDKYVSYNPTCTFYGYRFATISATDKVVIKSVRSIPVTSISKEMEIGTLTTGNELINKLISNTVWGQRSNYLSVPTDCPQRNERLGWMADTQVFTETGSFFANTDSFFHKWMRDVRDSQSELGGYPGVAPTAQYGAEPTSMMRLGWADAGIIVPWTIWKQYGDKDIIDECWESMEKFMSHVNDTKYDHDLLKAENGGYQWNDWLSYEPLENCNGTAHYTGPDGIRYPYPETKVYWKYLSASYWAIDAGMMRDMAKATGRTEDAAKYAAMEQDAKAYIRSSFFNENGEFKTGILNTMQTPALFALKNGIIKDSEREATMTRLLKNFADHGNCLQTGFLGTSILMDVLTENGAADMAYELLFQRKNPSWLYSVDNGATTIWERWNSYMLDKGMGPKGMNSFNHYAYGCVCAWIWKTAAGIAADPAEPAFKHIIMKPVPDKRLGFVKARYNSAAGLITSEWKYDGDKWIWDFTVPEGSTATVTLPGDTSSKDYGAGNWHIERQ